MSDAGLIARLEAAGVPQGAAEAVASVGRTVSVAAGAVLFRPGDPCGGYVAPLAGSLAVVMAGQGGRELALYRVGPGELCLQTFQCLVTGAAYAAEGRVETAFEAVVVPPTRFDGLMAQSAPFRGWVLAQVARRFAMMAQLVEAVATAPIPQRLAGALLRLADADDVVRATHAELAAEIASAREVVSRALAAFAAHGLVQAGRGRIVLCNRDALSRTAGGLTVT